MKDTTHKQETTLQQLGITQLHGYAAWLDHQVEFSEYTLSYVDELPAVAALWQEVGNLVQVSAEMFGMSSMYEEELITNPWFSGMQLTPREKEADTVVKSEGFPSTQYVNKPAQKLKMEAPIEPMTNSLGKVDAKKTVSKAPPVLLPDLGKAPDRKVVNTSTDVGHPSLSPELSSEEKKAQSGIKLPNVLPPQARHASSHTDEKSTVSTPANPDVPQFLPSLKGLGDFAGFVNEEETAHASISAPSKKEPKKPQQNQSVPQEPRVESPMPQPDQVKPFRHPQIPQTPIQNSTNTQNEWGQAWDRLEEQVNKLYSPAPKKEQPNPFPSTEMKAPLDLSIPEIKPNESVDLQSIDTPESLAQSSPITANISPNSPVSEAAFDFNENENEAAEPDMEDILEALSARLSQEYKRYYGS